MTSTRWSGSDLRARRSLLAAVLLLPASLMLWAAASAQAATSGTLHAPPGTVYVTNLNLNTVTAIDPTTHHLTTISGAGGRLNGPLGIAIAPSGAMAFVTNSLANSVTPIDIAVTPAVVERPFAVGSGPSAIAITPNGATAYVSNFNDNTVTPVNLRTTPPTSGAPIPVGLGPWSIAISPNGTTVCVSDSEGSSVSIINAKTRQVTNVAVGSRPQAIAISPDGSTAYVANGIVLSTINISSAVPSTSSSIAVPDGPVGIAITPDGSKLYTANNNHTVTPINLKTNPVTPETPVQVGSLSQPDGIAISPDGSTAYAANASNTVTPINLKTNPATPLAPIQVGTATFGIAIAPDQAPVAHLQVIPGHVGKPSTFIATSTGSIGISRYHWNFGDGTTRVTINGTTTHVYNAAGTYQASVVETTRFGTSLARTYTGQTVSNNGSGTARASQTLVISASFHTTPTSGPPGIAVTLADGSFTGTCSTVYILFDKNLIAQTVAHGTNLFVSHLVIPGNATLGTHHLYLSCSVAGASIVATTFLVTATKNHLSEFSVAMPGPGELKRHLVSAGGISIGMLLISRLIAAGFPSEWLDSTYEANRHRLHSRLRRRYPKLFTHHQATTSSRLRILRAVGLFMGFLLMGGVINSFLDPNFGFNRTSLWLYLGQCLGIGIVTLSSQLPVVVDGIVQGRRIRLQVLAGGMIIAIVCVLTSRLVGLSPGYCYGLIAIFLVNPHVTEKDWGRIHAISSLVVLVVSTSAFFLTVPVFHLATMANPSPVWLILNPALNVTFLAGFASLAFGMFPLPFLAGRYVAKWNRWAWLGITLAGLIGFVAVLMSPGSGSSNELHHIALVPLLVAFVVFAALSLGLMLYFHRRAAAIAEAEEEMEAAIFGDETAEELPGGADVHPSVTPPEDLNGDEPIE